MQEIEAAAILFAIVLMAVVPLLFRDLIRLRRHDTRSAIRDSERAETPE